MCVCIFEGQQIILTKLQPLNTNDLLWSWNLLRYLKLFKAGPRETLGRRMKWKVGSTRGILCILQTYFSSLKNKFVSPSLLANGFEGSLLANGFEGRKHIVTFLFWMAE